MRGGDGEVVQVRAIKNDEGNQNPHFVFRTGKTPSSPALGGSEPSTPVGEGDTTEQLTLTHTHTHTQR